MNNKYKITVESPLLRAGLKIETECSEKYLTKVVSTLMDKVREINSPDYSLEDLKGDNNSRKKIL